MLASLINNLLMILSLGTRPASAAPSVGRAWSPQMSQTRMESFIAKASGVETFWVEVVPCTESCLCLPGIRLLSLAVWALGR